MQNSEIVFHEVMGLLEDTGSEAYFGEAVTKLQHAVQCA